MPTTREYTDLLKLVDKLPEDLAALEARCESQCVESQVKSLIAEYDIPAFLLESDYSQSILESGDMKRIRKLLSDRHKLFYGLDPRVVEDIGGKEK